MLKDLIILFLVIYLIYKVMSRFVLPLLNVTAAANNHVRKMQEQMNAQMQEMDRQRNNVANSQQTKKKVEKEGDYIDYEEVK
jgi:hypothetical protein